MPAPKCVGSGQHSEFDVWLVSEDVAASGRKSSSARPGCFLDQFIPFSAWVIRFPIRRAFMTSPFAMAQLYS